MIGNLVVAVLLGLVAAIIAFPDEKTFDPSVALTHCVRFGPNNDFQLEWQLSGEPKNLLELRFMTDVLRGFSAIGFTKGRKIQVLNGWPVEQTACARSLYDTYSPYDVDGNVYPNYPEVPANIVTANASHAIHYVMRNISTHAKRLVSQGISMTTNVTLLWAYQQSSLFKGACYMGNVDAVTEQAEINLVLGDSEYLLTNGVCKPYAGRVLSHHGTAALGAEKSPPERLLDGEMHQNTRVAALLFGGDAILQSGHNVPHFDAVTGFVKPGENHKGVCQDSPNIVRVVWDGFSDLVGGVKEYQVTAGTATQPSLYLDRVSAGTNLALTASITGVLLKNQTLIVSVTAFNFAGLTRTVTAKPIRVLNDRKPVFGVMYDGTVAETQFGIKRYQKETTTLAAHWDNWIREDYSQKDYNTGAFTDGGYEYAIGETSGAADGILAWTSSASFDTQRVVSGLALHNGKTYAMSIRTTNCAGVQVTQKSPGVTIDVYPPTGGFVYFGNKTLSHQAKVHRSGRLMASWTGFVDFISGIARYEWAMGLSRVVPSFYTNTDMIMGWTDVGKVSFAQNITIDQLPQQSKLTVGTNIYVYVKAIDAVGNVWARASNATEIVAN